MVTTTGRMSPSCDWVWALKPLQNSMILTPCWPRAGPTGGEGFAFPAGSWSFTKPVIFFMTVTLRPSALLDCGEIELHARRPPENGDLHLELLLVHLHVVDRAGEVGKRAVQHANLLADLEGQAGLRLHRTLDDPAAEVVDLGHR